LAKLEMSCSPPPAELVAGEPGYYESRELLSSAGVGFVEARRAAGVEAVMRAAAEIGYPVVLKALGELHKSDSGGVAVGLQGPEQLNDAFTRMEGALSPPAYSVEAMAPLTQGLELIVGAKRDPRFGPILLVGAGGLYAEIVKDVAVALAPVTEAAAEALFRSLQTAPLLDGARGKPAVDVGAAARVAAALSRFAAQHPEVAEVEINPLLALPDGAFALDARIVLEADAR
jgi:succinyl-CoA synthetase beta subunit